MPRILRKSYGSSGLTFLRVLLIIFIQIRAPIPNQKFSKPQWRSLAYWSWLLQLKLSIALAELNGVMRICGRGKIICALIFCKFREKKAYLSRLEHSTILSAHIPVYIQLLWCLVSTRRYPEKKEGNQ